MKSKIISIRSLRLTYDALPLIDPKGINSRNPVETSKYEVEKGVLPVSVIRYAPSGFKQVIPIKPSLKQ
ncbi:MAG: hypothetical protein G5Z43_000266 [Caldisphaeraceae archaeon]|nr:hypothetical protein [Caldisphaeraceae archaeon]MEB3691361.1 hypothetical protein [Caldisphaeraceae archaeon]